MYAYRTFDVEGTSYSEATPMATVEVPIGTTIPLREGTTKRLELSRLRIATALEESIPPAVQGRLRDNTSPSQ